MDTDEQLPPNPDLISVRRGSRTSHRSALFIYGYGILGYAVLSLVMLVFYEFNRDQVIFARSMTLPLDTALALLGLCATVLIALVASLWASGQFNDAGLSRGRRRALTVVTFTTGLGSVIVGTAAAAHRPTGGWNFITVAVIFGLGLVLAYIAADVVFFVIEDRALDEALRRQDAENRRATLRIARRNWLRLSRRAGWKRGRRPLLDRLRQATVLTLVLVAVLAAVLAALGGRRAITGYVGWLFLDVAVGLLVGQLATHYLATKFVARQWEQLWWLCLSVLMYVLVSLWAQWELLVFLEAELFQGLSDYVLGSLLVLASYVLAPLGCLLGLTVFPRRWHRFRPMTQIRWSVIAAMGHEMDLAVAGLEASSEHARPTLKSRLGRAIRRATGAEEVAPGEG